MNVPTDPFLQIESWIARMKERIARWNAEADAIEVSWSGGPEYARFCQAMGAAARQKKENLEVELKQLQRRQ